MRLSVLDELVVAGIHGRTVASGDVADVLASDDADLMDVVAAAARVRRRYFGDRVRLHHLVNLNSRLCPPNCVHCAHRMREQTKYSWLTPREAAETAAAGVSGGATTVCVVLEEEPHSQEQSTRVRETVAAIRKHNPRVAVFACPGHKRQSRLLSASGISTCQPHSRGFASCAGIIAGRGESDNEILQTLFALRAERVTSVPVSFLIPFEGTKLAGTWTLNPRRCLRILAAARFVHPDAEIRLADGRKSHLRGMQPLALHLVDSLVMSADESGLPGELDVEMILDAGFSVEKEPAGSHDADRP